MVHSPGKTIYTLKGNAKTRHERVVTPPLFFNFFFLSLLATYLQSIHAA